MTVHSSQESFLRLEQENEKFDFPPSPTSGKKAKGRTKFSDNREEIELKSRGQVDNCSWEEVVRCSNREYPLTLLYLDTVNSI